MESYIGKRVRILIKPVSKGEEILYYTATILGATSTHITFIDKFGTSYTYLISCVAEISEIREHANEKCGDSGSGK